MKLLHLRGGAILSEYNFPGNRTEDFKKVENYFIGGRKLFSGGIQIKAPLRWLDIIFFNFTAKGRQGNSQKTGRFGFVPAKLMKGF